MVPSTSLSTHRPPSSLSQRPVSSLSHRPLSSASQRPPSSASHRPPSSLSSRPISSASMRPHSRVSQRPHSRHARSRLLPLSQTLVTLVTGLREAGAEGDEGDSENYRTAVDWVLKNLEATTLNKAAVGVDMGVMDRQIRGHAEKARIKSRDSLAEALETSYQRLKTQAAQENDLDQEIKLSRLPDHLQLLVQLSVSPIPETLAYADYLLHELKNPPRPHVLTWKDILAEEPFEGEHWQGVYGLPPGSIRNNKDEWNGSRSGGSTPSLSPLDSDDLELDADDSFSSLSSTREDDENSSHKYPAGPSNAESRPPQTFVHRKAFEDLQAKQYWKSGWRSDVVVRRGFDIGDASTLGPTLQRVLARERTNLAIDALQHERYIDEQDSVREILMALQGRKNLMLVWTDGSFMPPEVTPRLVHLSLSSQSSIISSFARIATTVQHLRHFTAFVFTQSQSSKLNPNKFQSAYTRKSRSRMTRTLEAFAEAVDEEIRMFDAWCAEREEDMCRAQAGVGDGELVVSLLGTEKALRDAFESSFLVLLEIVTMVHGLESVSGSRLPGTGEEEWNLPTGPPAAITACLLDTMFEAVQEHLERGDDVTADALMRVFVKSSKPIWEMIGTWLRHGMGAGMGTEEAGMDLDDEFFIENNGLGIGIMSMGLLDPEFWAEGYALRDGVSGDDEDGHEASGVKTKMIPVFLEHVAELVLSSGKAIGLLRALGVPPLVDDKPWLGDWRSFGSLLASKAKHDALDTSGSGANTAGEIQLQQGGDLFSVSIDSLSRLVYDELLPHCQATGAFLVKVLVDDCDLWKHLSTIEDLFLMRRGDAMSHFTDVLFAKMDSQQSWGDFHFLNAAFSEVVEAGANVGAKEWVQTPLVRLSYRGGKDKDKTINRTVKAIDGLLVEYAVPFPLTYIFPPRVLQVYGDILVFLLQIRRAKSVLERILVRGEGSSGRKVGSELKVFYAMRSRLSWFINTFLNFLTTNVIHTQVQKFHSAFGDAKSLDEMIQLHGDHLEKIQGRCFLQTNTSSLHRAILSILDMSLHFSDAFVTFAGDTTTTHDISRQSIIMKRHRSRREKQQRRNVIGFSQSTGYSPDTSEDDESDFDEHDTLQPPEPSFFTAGLSTSSAGDGFYGRIDKMSSELDGLVRFVRRGVESLAGGTGEAAPAFGVLAFGLEDWDN